MVPIVGEDGRLSSNGSYRRAGQACGRGVSKNRRRTPDAGFLTLRLRENLEVLAVDEIVNFDEAIAGSFHFASDFFFLNSVTE